MTESRYLWVTRGPTSNVTHIQTPNFQNASACTADMLTETIYKQRIVFKLHFNIVTVLSATTEETTAACCPLISAVSRCFFFTSIPDVIWIVDRGGFPCSPLIDCPMKPNLMSSSHIRLNRLAVICHEQERGRSGVFVTAVTLCSKS